ncbi:MAG: hypothetical protein L0220_07255, partial [Acidobacteria bacterium]|nr:hypothetical protein [Acidobacteriota bacterium]
MRSDAKYTDLTGKNPNSRISPKAFNPADAMHPHWEQSGLPPNWQGLIRAFKSAVMLKVVRAKMH